MADITIEIKVSVLVIARDGSSSAFKNEFVSCPKATGLIAQSLVSSITNAESEKYKDPANKIVYFGNRARAKFWEMYKEFSS